MQVYKYIDNYYIAKATIKGKYYNGYGTTHAEAIANLLTTINN